MDTLLVLLAGYAGPETSERASEVFFGPIKSVEERVLHQANIADGFCDPMIPVLTIVRELRDWRDGR